MKKSIFLLTATFLMLFAVTPNLMAKEKKVKYLGHNYRGEVDDNKVPSGKGIMNVNGLMIEGTFNNCTVTDAEVWRTENLGTINTTFKGTITYDESENIVLKANGILYTKYYLDFNVNYPQFITDTLRIDKSISSKNFEKSYLSIPISIMNNGSEMMTLLNRLNAPVLCYESIPLTHITKQNVNMDVFIANDFSNIISQKDKEGRIWEINFFGSNEDSILLVKYPDNSFIKYKKRRYGREGHIESEIYYPNGSIIKINGKGYKEWFFNISLDNIKLGARSSFVGQDYQRMSLSIFASIFLHNVGKDSFHLSNQDCPYELLIFRNTEELSKLPNNEVENLISKELLPIVDKSVFIKKRWDIGNWEYYDGKCIKNRDVAKREEEEAAEKAKKAAAAKEMRSYIAQFKKKYGFDPSAISYKNVIVPGRSWNALAAWNEWCNSYGNFTATIFVTLLRDSGSSKYYSFGMGAYKGYFWITNGKITSVRWY